uniref:Uncharacterized protein n=1 Tax=Timema bartmani TaxID=61472 RepID=A0A7R9EUI0_9NEOP|nr:unnamed protein product [Timema bartmani]
MGWFACASQASGGTSAELVMGTIEITRLCPSLCRACSSDRLVDHHKARHRSGGGIGNYSTALRQTTARPIERGGGKLETLEGRELQVKMNKLRALEEAHEQARENEYVQLRHQEHVRLKAEHDKKMVEFKKKYSQDLRDQMEYTKLIRKRERDELDRQFVAGLLEEECYTRLVAELIGRPLDGPKHPFNTLIKGISLSTMFEHLQDFKVLACVGRQRESFAFEPKEDSESGQDKTSYKPLFSLFLHILFKSLGIFILVFVSLLFFNISPRERYVLTRAKRAMFAYFIRTASYYPFGLYVLTLMCNGRVIAR